MRSLLMFFPVAIPCRIAGRYEPASSRGLLFYLSGDHGFRADYAARDKPEPNFLKDAKILPGGAKGSYLQCSSDQLLSCWAPGNIYPRRVYDRMLSDDNIASLAKNETPQSIPALPVLYPKTATVSLTLPADINWKGGSVTIEPGGSLPEITQRNDRVELN